MYRDLLITDCCNGCTSKGDTYWEKVRKRGIRYRYRHGDLRPYVVRGIRIGNCRVHGGGVEDAGGGQCLCHSLNRIRIGACVVVLAVRVITVHCGIPDSAAGGVGEGGVGEEQAVDLKGCEDDAK